MLKFSQSKPPYQSAAILCVCVYTQYVHILYTGVCVYMHTVTVWVGGGKHGSSSEINGESGILKCCF